MGKLNHTPAVLHGGQDCVIRWGIAIPGRVVLATGAIIDGPCTDPTGKIRCSGVENQQLLSHERVRSLGIFRDALVAIPAPIVNGVPRPDNGVCRAFYILFRYISRVSNGIDPLPWDWTVEFEGEQQSGQFAVGRLDVRLLTARVARLFPGRWDHPQLTNTHWRLYQHDMAGGWLSDASGQTWELEPGGVYLIPPVGPLSSRCTAPFRQLYLHFDLLGFPGIIALRELFPGPVRVPASPGFESSVTNLADRMAEAPSASWHTDPARECWVRGVVCEALGRYLAETPQERFERYDARIAALSPVIPALRYIHSHLAESIANRDLAARCNMSEDYFIRRFQAATGVPPNQYVLRCRVDRAARLLLTTDASIEAVATQTGFRDRFYFSRVFRRLTGRPPAAFRRGVSF